LDSENCLPETFAKKTGLWIGAKRSLNLLEAMTNLPLTEGEKASLFRWTPIQSEKSRYWSLGSEEISMSHVRPGGFSCPACLREGAFHRVWWDFRLFHTCPVHDCPMQENPERHDRRWPYYGLCLTKVNEPPVLSPQGRGSLEGYILQRLNAVDFIMARPLLDEAPLSAVLSIAPRVGVFLSNPPLWKMPGKHTSLDVAVGFEALGRSEDHLVNRFSEWLRKHYGEDDLKSVGLGQFGFMRHLTKAQSSLKRAVNIAQIKACARHGLLNPKIRSRPDVDAPLAKSNLHTVMGLTPHSADLLLERHGIDLQKGSRAIVEIPMEIVTKIRSEVDNAVPLDEAARQLGCSVEEVDLVAMKLAKKGWKTCIQKRRDGGIQRLFILDELRRLSDILQSFPLASKNVQTTSIRGRVRPSLLSETRLMADALRGVLPAFRDPQAPGLSGLRFYKVKRGGPASIGRTKVPEDAMLRSEFYAMAGIGGAGSRKLVRDGFLEQHPSKTSYLTRASAVAFFERYMSPMRYFRGRGMDFLQASAAVLDLGLPIAFSRKEFGLTLVERRLFQERINDFSKPSASALELWSHLVRLGRDNCPSFIIPEVPGDGMFVIFPTTRILPVSVVLREASIHFELEVRPHFRRLWKTFVQLLEDYQVILESFEWQITDERVAITAVAADIDAIARITQEFGRLNQHFRHKMP